MSADSKPWSPWCFAWEDVEAPELDFERLLKPRARKAPEASEPEIEAWVSAMSGRKKKRRDAKVGRRIQTSEMDMRTVRFTAGDRRQIDMTCLPANVRGLRTNQWALGDGSIHATGHTLSYARMGEITASIILRAHFAEENEGWHVGNPDFRNRRGRARDRGDIPITSPDGIVTWVEVKTITNRNGWTKGAINRTGRLGYVFQRLKHTFRTGTLELTPTFDSDHYEHEHVMSSLLIGVVCTPLKGGAVACTVSKSVFLKPIRDCKFVKLQYCSKKDAGLKRATVDHCVV